MFTVKTYATKTLIATTAVIGMLSAGSAMADPQPDQSRSKQVVLSDLDLSTAQGQQVAQERVHQMARRLCSQVADNLDLSHQSNYVACIESAMAKGNVALQALSTRKAATVVVRNQ